jgi:hypothetical protein
MGIFNTIHPPSKPQAAQGLPDDMDVWTPAQFIIYHKNLITLYGKEQARLIFNMDIQSVGYDAVIYWSGAYNCSWINYAKRNNLDYYGGITTTLYCGTGDVIENVSDTAGAVSGAASSLSKLILPVVLFGLVLVAANHKKVYQWARRKQPQ